jgi:hypothetical protein
MSCLLVTKAGKVDKEMGMSVGQRGVALSLAVMAGLVAFTFVTRNWVHSTGPWASMAAVAVAVVAAFASTGLWWRRIDEAAREAHKSAWYWGACIGIAAGGAGLVALTVFGGAPPLILDRAPSPVGYFTSGALALLAAQVLGYAAAWAWWWGRRYQ